MINIWKEYFNVYDKKVQSGRSSLHVHQITFLFPLITCNQLWPYHSSGQWNLVDLRLYLQHLIKNLRDHGCSVKKKKNEHASLLSHLFLIPLLNKYWLSILLSSFVLLGLSHLRPNLRPLSSNTLWATIFYIPSILSEFNFPFPHVFQIFQSDIN